VDAKPESADDRVDAHWSKAKVAVKSLHVARVFSSVVEEQQNKVRSETSVSVPLPCFVWVFVVTCVV